MPTNTPVAELSDNPAIPSMAIESLFPEGVAAAELRAPGAASMLKAAEAEYVARAVPKRIEEFAAGRLCARRALERFGVTDFALRAAPDRQPMWPHSLVGSITHTAGFCAAVVGELRLFIGLGVDTETAGAVTAELRPSICTAAELAWIDSLPADDRARAATLIFSAKEAFYKCQYPHTGEHLGFADLRITPLDWGESQGSFAVAPTRDLAVLSRHGASACRGSYRFHEQFVSAGVCMTQLEGS